jgi:Mg-chelatase subunit ChlD
LKKALLVFLLMMCLSYIQVQAERPPIDAVLVLDVSNSMRQSDPNRLAQEAMGLFINRLGLSGDRIGVVAYAGEVVGYFPMATLDNAETQAELLTFINATVHAGWTDHSLGLEKALQLFQQDFSGERTPIILLLTDGNTEISPNAARTLADAQADLEKILDTAVHINLPIYTIGLNHNGMLNRAYIEKIAQSTGARSFETMNAEGLPDIVNEILANYLSLTTAEEHRLLADGEIQWTAIEIPNAYISEAHIMVFSALPLSEVTLRNPHGYAVAWNENVVFSQSWTYSLIILTDPMAGVWTLGTQGIAGEAIRLTLFYREGEPPPPILIEINKMRPVQAPTSVKIFFPDEASYTWTIILIGGIAMIIFMFILLLARKRSRVFTGRLILETNGQPQLYNLIPYGKRTTFHALLGGSTKLAKIILTPSPTAPSHKPQLLLTCKYPSFTFRKDFHEYDAKKGLNISPGSEVTIQLPDDSPNIHMKYVA